MIHDRSEALPSPSVPEGSADVPTSPPYVLTPESDSAHEVGDEEAPGEAAISDVLSPSLDNRASTAEGERIIPSVDGIQNQQEIESQSGGADRNRGGANVPQLPPLPVKTGWMSWQIRSPWLSFVLSMNIAFITTIVSLDVISRRDHGFVHLGDAPGFLAHDPGLEEAIWAQGIFYTALPAFIMTVFQSCWHEAVGALAKRQPFVELKNPDGAPARKTILLDYTEPFALRWYSAWKNQHYLLAACMLSSAALMFLAVPLTSFLITTIHPVFNSTLPLSVETAFNTSILGQYPSFPNMRYMDMAAAIHVQGASPPPWTDGQYAFPQVVSLDAFGKGNLSFPSTAYSAHVECVHLDEKQYRKSILGPGDTGLPALTITITANDRGCQIYTDSNFRLTPEAPKISINSWTTTTCPAHAGWSRISFLTARVTEDEEIADLSLVSCAPSYHTTLGNVTTYWEAGARSPQIKSFEANSVSESRSDAIWRFFEMALQDTQCYDPGEEVDTNEFGRQIYRLASYKAKSLALHPNVIIASAQTMFSTAYTVFTSLYLLQPTDRPTRTLGLISTQPTRLTLVSPIAYIIIGILVTVAGLNAAAFSYGRRASVLLEAPVGLLAAATILNGSDDVSAAIRDIKAVPKCNNRVLHTALHRPPKTFEQSLWTHEPNSGVRRVSNPQGFQLRSGSMLLSNVRRQESQGPASNPQEHGREEVVVRIDNGSE